MNTWCPVRLTNRQLEEVDRVYQILIHYPFAVNSDTWKLANKLHGKNWNNFVRYLLPRFSFLCKYSWQKRLWCSVLLLDMQLKAIESPFEYMPSMSIKLIENAFKCTHSLQSFLPPKTCAMHNFGLCLKI